MNTVFPPSTTRPAGGPRLLSEVLGLPPLEDPLDSAPPSFPEAWYDSARKEYLLQNSGGRWLAHGESNFKRLLRSRGFLDRLTEEEQMSGKTVSQAEEVLLKL